MTNPDVIDNLHNILSPYFTDKDNHKFEILISEFQRSQEALETTQTEIALQKRPLLDKLQTLEQTVVEKQQQLDSAKSVIAQSNRPQIIRDRIAVLLFKTPKLPTHLKIAVFILGIKPVEQPPILKPIIASKDQAAADLATQQQEIKQQLSDTSKESDPKLVLRTQEHNRCRNQLLSFFEGVAIQDDLLVAEYIKLMPDRVDDISQSWAQKNAESLLVSDMFTSFVDQTGRLQMIRYRPKTFGELSPKARNEWVAYLISCFKQTLQA